MEEKVFPVTLGLCWIADIFFFLAYDSFFPKSSFEIRMQDAYTYVTDVCNQSEL